MMTKEAYKGYVAHTFVDMSMDDDKKLTIIGIIGGALNKAYPDSIDEKMKSKEVVTKTSFIAICRICLTDYGFTTEHIKIFLNLLNKNFKEYSTKSAHLYYAGDSWLDYEEDGIDEEDEYGSGYEDSISNLQDHFE